MSHYASPCGSIQHSTVMLRPEVEEAESTKQFVEGGPINSIFGVLRHFGYVKQGRGKAKFKHKHLNDVFHLQGSRWDHYLEDRRIASGHGHESLHPHLEEHHK